MIESSINSSQKKRPKEISYFTSSKKKRRELLGKLEEIKLSWLELRSTRKLRGTISKIFRVFSHSSIIFLTIFSDKERRDRVNRIYAEAANQQSELNALDRKKKRK